MVSLAQLDLKTAASVNHTWLCYVLVDDVLSDVLCRSQLDIKVVSRVSLPRRHSQCFKSLYFLRSLAPFRLSLNAP